ncbi:NADH-quinone oxidoreductase subunit J [bacterium]|nr:NADH-quinone oxidoreductase subunit J [bacterium]
MINQVLFIVLSVVAIVSALGVVMARNPMYSVLSLIVCFFAIGGHYLMLAAEFLAIVHIIVYAGAIMVLFLFVIMMLNLNETAKAKYHLATRLFGIGLGGVLCFVLIKACLVAGSIPKSAYGITGDVRMLGRLLFTRYTVAFEFSSVLFLAAVVGVVFLGKTPKESQ